MDKKFALSGSSERFFLCADPEVESDGKPDAPLRPRALSSLLVLGVALFSFAVALGAWESGGEGRGGELSAAVEVIGEAIEAERQGEEY